MINPFLEVRAALDATTNTTGGDTRTGLGGNTINKQIEQIIVDDVNREVDFVPLVKKTPHDQLGMLWNLRIDLGSTNKTTFYIDGGTGTPFGSTIVQLYLPGKSLRSDYAVTGLQQAGSASFYNALADEARDAAASHILGEEKTYLCGNDTSAYGISGSNTYDGLLQLMGSYVTFGDTDSIYGTNRVSGSPHLDVSLVGAGATTTDSLTLADLDSAITKSNKAGGKRRNRIFLVSEERGDEIDQLIQPQGRFVIGAREAQLDGGLTVNSYKNINIIRDRFMDKNGVIFDGGKSFSYADQAMYLLDMDAIDFFFINGVNMTHIPVVGTDSGMRVDESGGYFKTYGAFRMKKFRTSVLIYNLAAP